MTDPDVFADLERELTLLARHHLPAARRASELHLERSAFQILSRLQMGPLTLAELAAAFRLDISTVNRQVGALLRQEYVERIAAPDTAARPVRATRAGLAALRRDRAQIHASLSQITDDWSAEQISDLALSLRHFNESIEEREGSPWPRP